MNYIKLNIKRFGATISATAYETNVSIGDNTSYVQLSITITTTGQTYNNSNQAYVDATLIGQHNTYSIPRTIFNISKNTTKVVYTGTLGPFTHNPDGTLGPITINCSSYVTSNYSPSTTIYCNMSTIARKTNIGNIISTIGYAVDIPIYPSDPNFRHTLMYNFGSVFGTVADKTDLLTISFIPSTSLYAQIPNSQQGIGSMTLITYNGDSEVGRSTSQLILNADPVSSKPVISNVSLVDTNSVTKALTGNENIIVRNASNISMSISGQTKHYSPPKSLMIGGGAISVSSSESNGTYTINTVYTEDTTTRDSFNVILTDTRGYPSDVYSVNNTIIDYITPTINLEWVRPTPTGSTIVLNSLSGNCFVGSFGKTSNSMIIRYRYKEGYKSYSNWVNISNKVTLHDNNTFEKSGDVVISGLDYRENCTIEVEYSDKIKTNTSTITVKSGQPLWYWTDKKFKINTPLYVESEKFLIPKELYTYTNGDDTNEVTLGDNVKNYKYIEVYYRLNNRNYKYTKFDPNIITRIVLDGFWGTSEGLFQFQTKSFDISNNKMTTSSPDVYINISNGNVQEGTNTGETVVTIIKVIGYA